MSKVIARAMVVVLALPSGAWAQAEGPGTADRGVGDRGRALFQGHQTFAAGEAATLPPLPAAFVACANCHGPQGAGQREGGVDIPAITLSALVAPQGRRGAFASDAAILAAIQDGIGRDQRNLAPQMPRYRLNPDEAVDLMDYLHRVGTPLDLPAGVTGNEIRLGALLPLSGGFAPQGRAVLAGMQAVIAATNAAGGIHGRQVVLIAADSRLPAAEDTLLAQDIFAVIGGMWDARNPRIEAALEQARVPLIASLLLREGDSAPGAWATDLLPSRAVQQRLLAAAVAQCDVTGPRWLIGTAPAAGVDRIFATSAAFGQEPVPPAVRGCIGFAISESNATMAQVPPRWSRRIGLPFPRPVLENPDGGIWHTLGSASARIGIEALAVSGAALYERAPLEAVSRLNGFEPLQGAPVRFSKQRRYGWDADVLVDNGAGVLAPSENLTLQ